MLTNRSMPSAGVIPELAYANVGDAADWLCRVFGFAVRLRIGDHRVQLDTEGGAVIVVQSPTAPLAGTADHCVMVRVGDVSGHHDHAKAMGAHILAAPVDYPFGERQYSVIDPGGHHWTFSQSIADVDPRDWGGVPE